MQEELEESAVTPKGIELLQVYMASDNIADLLEQEELDKIGQRCVRDFEADDESRQEWLKRAEDGIKIAKQVVEEKNWPWPKAANVKFPLLAQASIEFAARAYPELVKGNVVKGAVIGRDPDGQKAARADRVATFMGTYQIRYGMPYWEDETDALLLQLPLVGMAFRKSFYDPIYGVQSRLVDAQNFVVNDACANHDLVRRESEILPIMSENEVTERVRSQLWVDAELSPLDGEEDKTYSFIEQHRWLDLDDDGYEEPYVVTFSRKDGKVVRIVARFDAEDVKVNSVGEVAMITPKRYYTAYRFMPSFGGGFYAMGLASLLLPLNESINTILNQLLDAGTLSNLQSGFISKGIRLKTGSLKIQPGEWKPVDSSGADLKNSIVPLPVKEPSAVLFQLLGLLIEVGKELANIKDILQGNAPNANVPATTVLALIEQGQKVFSAIYKRVYRSMRDEFAKLFKINKQSLPKELYVQVLDDPQANEADWESNDYDIGLEADPTMSSDVQLMAQAQALMQLMQIPGVNQGEIVKTYLRALKVENVDKYYNSEAAAAQQQQAMQLQMAQLQAENNRKNAETFSKVEQAQAGVKKTLVEAMKTLAETGQIAALLPLEIALKQVDIALGGGNGTAQPGGMAGVAAQPGNDVATGNAPP